MRLPITWGDSLHEALFEIHEQIASSNGIPVHGSYVSRFTPHQGRVLVALRDDPRGCAQLLDAIRQHTSMGGAGLEDADVEDFPPSLRDQVAEALLLLRVHPLQDFAGEIRCYAFAILPNSRIVTANEPVASDGVVNPWPPESE